MAKQTGLIKFTGQIGGLVGYRRGEHYYLRSAAEVVHQSARTIASSRAFGKASKLGGAIRHALCGTLAGPVDGSSVNRLNKALLAVLQADDLHGTKRFIPRHFKCLRGFGFNPHAGLDKVLTVTPAVHRDATGNIAVTIPAMTRFNCNPGATHLCITATAVRLSQTFRSATAASSASVFIDVNQPSAELTLTIPARNAAVTCVVLEVTNHLEEQGRMVQLMNRLYYAADVIAVLGGKVRRRVRKRRMPAASRKLTVIPGLPVGFYQRE